MQSSSKVLAGAVFAAFLGALSPAHAQTVMQQCGQQYQAAKAAGTLNGMTWGQFRTDCASRMKATPASTTTTTPAAPVAPAAPAAPASPPPIVANPLKPTPAPVTTTAAAPAAPPVTAPAAPGKMAAPASAGRTAMLTRERQCGAEWRAQKVTLVAQTPGLTWPKYWHECNTRLKAAGQ